MGREEMFQSIPMKSPEVSWEESKTGRIRLKVERKNTIYRIIKIFTGKVMIDKVPLDRYGSFIWKHVDGKTSVQKMQELLEDEYGEELEDVRERTYRYFRSLVEYEFVVITNPCVEKKETK